MSLQSVFENTKHFSDILKALLVVKETHDFHIASEGIAIHSLDPSHAMLGDFFIPKESFLIYEAKEGVVGVSVSDMKRFIGSGSESEKLLFSIEDRICLSIYKKDASKKLFLSKLAPSEESQELKSLDFSFSIELTPQSFKNSVETIIPFGNVVELVGNSDHFVLKAYDEAHTKEALIEIPRNSEYVKSFNSKKETVSRYSAELFKEIASIASLSDTVKISFSDDFPVLIEYSVTKMKTCRYLLAPRVE